jgi:hypothetical protein
VSRDLVSRLSSAVALAIVLLLGVRVGAAGAYSELVVYKRGYLAPTQGYASYTDDATYPGWCTAIWLAELDKPGTYWGTAALIAPDGSWMRSYRGTGPSVGITVIPLSFSGAVAYRKKAYVKNSDPFWVYAATAKLGRFVSNNPGCPIQVF